MENPFSILEARLARIENLLLDISAPRPVSIPQVSALEEYTPVESIFKKKLMSPPTFYEKVKAGQIDLHKVGRKSFIRTSDFHKLFRKVEIAAA